MLYWLLFKNDYYLHIKDELSIMLSLMLSNHMLLHLTNVTQIAVIKYGVAKKKTIRFYVTRRPFCIEINNQNPYDFMQKIEVQRLHVQFCIRTEFCTLTIQCSINLPQ